MFWTSKGSTLSLPCSVRHDKECRCTVIFDRRGQGRLFSPIVVVKEVLVIVLNRISLKRLGHFTGSVRSMHKCKPIRCTADRYLVCSNEAAKPVWPSLHHGMSSTVDLVIADITSLRRVCQARWVSFVRIQQFGRLL